MDNEEDYIELHRLLAKCKWNIANEQVKFSPTNRDHPPIIDYYKKKTRQIDDFTVDIPIIIKGDKR